MDSDTVKRTFLEEYKSYAEQVLFPSEQKVKKLLSAWKQPDYWRPSVDQADPKEKRVAAPSPVHRVRTRVKRVESVMDKILRRPDVFTAGLSSESFRKMNDTLGVRVILYFLSHLPLIDGELKKLGDKFEISPTDPPKAYLPQELATQLSLGHLNPKQKESGYASIHYIIRLKDSEIPEHQRPWFELQVRTLVEDVWGEIEHVLGYKPEKSASFTVKRQFQIISKQLAAVDEHFNLLHAELTRYQEEVEYTEFDPLNAENLPPELASMGIGCAQSEIDGLLKILVSRRISTVAALRQVATPKRLELIRNTFYNVEGRPPKNFEFVAHLAALVDSNDEQEQVARVKEQIDFFKGWESIKRSKNNFS